MTTRLGFRGFTKPAKIDSTLVTEKLSSMSVDELYVWWTGNPYRMRKASGRSNSLRTITEVKTPVPVKTLIERAAVARDGLGYSPETVRSGLFLHRGSKPAVYIALEKKADGSYVAATDYATPDPAVFQKSLKAGDVVIPAPEAKDTKKLAAPKK